MHSTAGQLRLMQHILTKYALLPFRQSALPGALVENVFAYVRSAEVLHTYDFVDVIEPDMGYGWQVKSTKSTTPITWKRAKLANSADLIQSSAESQDACQDLGKAIIDHCNAHAMISLDKYELSQIGYSRLILMPDGQATYFEKTLCTRQNPTIFDADDYVWRWSEPKGTVTKEQLPALHGVDRHTGMKCWAWHGRGENQLHFYGESNWWPESAGAPSFSFQLPSADEVLSVDQFLEMLSQLDV